MEFIGKDWVEQPSKNGVSFNQIEPVGTKAPDEQNREVVSSLVDKTKLTNDINAFEIVCNI